MIQNLSLQNGTVVAWVCVCHAGGGKLPCGAQEVVVVGRGNLQERARLMTDAQVLEAENQVLEAQTRSLEAELEV